MTLPQWKKVGFQGTLGNYAHLVLKEVCGDAEACGFATFEDVFDAAAAGQVDGAAIPIENSTIGRIADIHHLLPRTDLQLVGEFYLPIRHCLLGVKGASLAEVKVVRSQLPALAQCAGRLRAMGLKAVSADDTAGAARDVAEKGDPTVAALASSLAGEVYGLDVLDPCMNDTEHNTTRFVLLAREAVVPPEDVPCKVSLLFRVKDIPAALYKAMGGFATNGVNMTKLESYMLDGNFRVAQFYAELEGHVASPPMRRALEELEFFGQDVRFLGCYPAAR